MEEKEKNIDSIEASKSTIKTIYLLSNQNKDSTNNTLINPEIYQYSKKIQILLSVKKEKNS